MRVLLVEDDSTKLQAVASLLRGISDVSIELDTANDVGQAKRLLVEVRYDAVILDISLPTVSGLSANPIGGLELMEDVVRRDRYQKPHELIGLTAYENILQDAGPRFTSELWSLIYYDPSSTAWAEQITRKLRYLSVMLRSGSLPQNGCDLCILSALSVPEFSALLDLPWSWKPLIVERDCTSYQEGSFEGRGGTKRVIAACASQMGMTATAVLATKMIYNFVPRYIAMVGIAAGMEGTCGLGDVICADPCWDWGSGKFADAKGESVFQPAPRQLRLDAFLRSKLVALTQDGALWDSVRRDWRGGENQSVLRMHVAPFASGAAVLADTETVATIKSHNRQVVGIDMEAYGVFSAAHESPLPQPKAFVMKSVVDFANSQKSDAYQAYAAYTSASAVRYFAERNL